MLMQDQILMLLHISARPPTDSVTYYCKTTLHITVVLVYVQMVLHIVLQNHMPANGTYYIQVLERVPKVLHILARPCTNGMTY
jgi:hypothetical protein